MLGAIRTGLTAAGMRAASGGGEFSPTDISGLVLWLDSTDLSTLWTDTAGTTQVASNGDLVARWDDKSGQDNHVIESVSAPVYNTTGINSAPSLGFVDDSLLNTDFVLSQPFTVLMLADSTGEDSAGSVFFDNNLTDRCVAYRDSGGLQLASTSTTTITESSPTFGLQVYTFVFNGTSSEIRESGNSLVTGNAGANGFDGFRLGKIRQSVLASLRIGQVLIYNSALSGNDLADVESWLADKGGLTL